MITTDRVVFREALPNGGRLIGLDVGTKTIGTALCDAGWSFASPALLIRRTKFQKDKTALVALIGEQQVKGIVIGLPLNLTDGSESPRSQSSRAFARNMEDIGLPIFLQDERWSTRAVTRTLIEQDASRAKRAELVDKMAAAYILQGAIDALVSGRRNSSRKTSKPGCGSRDRGHTDTHVSKSAFTPGQKLEWRRGWRRSWRDPPQCSRPAPGSTRTSRACSCPAWRTVSAGRAATSRPRPGSGLLGALVAPLVGRLVDRIGAVPVLIGSALILGAAHAWMSAMTGGLWQFQIGVALLALSAPGISALVFGQLIARRFDVHRGFALGIATAGLSVSTLLLPPLIAWVIATSGWRSGYLVPAGIAIVAGLPIVLLAIRATRLEPIERDRCARPGASGRDGACGALHRDLLAAGALDRAGQRGDHRLRHPARALRHGSRAWGRWGGHAGFGLCPCRRSSGGSAWGR